MKKWAAAGANLLVRHVFDACTEADQGEVQHGRTLDEDLEYYVEHHAPEFCEYYGRASAPHLLRRFIQGVSTPELEDACRLERALGIPPEAWLRAEKTSDPYAALPPAPPEEE